MWGSFSFAGGFCCLEGCLMLGALPLASSLPPRPFWLTLVVAVIAQNLAAQYQFLEQHPLRKELTNRYGHGEVPGAELNPSEVQGTGLCWVCTCPWCCGVLCAASSRGKPVGLRGPSGSMFPERFL